MKASNGTDCRRQIWLLVLPGFQVMCFTAFSVFEVANKKAGNTVYDLHVLSDKGGPVPTSFGMNVSTEPMGTRDFDTLLIAVGMEIPSTPPGMDSYVKEASRNTRGLSSIAHGSCVVGDAGILARRI